MTFHVVLFVFDGFLICVRAGRQCVDLGFCYENRLEAEFGTPSFALPGGALHVPARNKCVAPSAAMDDELREDEILRKGPQMTDGMKPEECIAKNRAIVQNFYRQLGEERDETG